MTELDLYDKTAERWDMMNKVMEHYVRNEQPGAIAKKLGLRRVDVINYVNEWKETAVGSDIMRGRVEELLAMMDEHFSDLIREARKTLDSVNEVDFPSHQMLGQRTAAIKVIADLEQSRIDIMQKAGLLEAADMGDEMARMEETQRKVIAILQEVSFQCPNCKVEVAQRIGALTNEAQTIDVEVVDG